MIHVEALTRTYGDLVAVNNVYFKIGQGEIVGLLGHNGAGKTTIMKMLTGYLEPTSGSIRIDDLDLAIHREAIQQHIGYLPENDPLYPEMTVIDYLDYVASLYGIAACERADKIRYAIDKTELETKAVDAIGTLSRGFRQRVGVAQAILHQPRLLILDEPTNGLDPTQVQHMRDLICALSKNATLIISTHILQEVQAVCDRVIIIRSGKKALDATMDELQTGKRLVVSVNADPEQASRLFKSVNSVQRVEPLIKKGPGYRYALDLGGQEEQTEAAPSVANKIMTAGFKLYALQHEGRDLETIFGEISTMKEGALQ